jgi:hypothetical protein
MAKPVASSVPQQAGNRYEALLGYYMIALSVVMLVFGLRQWAIILGVLPGGGGTFEAMSVEWKILTMHMAVVDLVAAVGLWMRAPWGAVVWVYAAISEIVFHTVFIVKFGADWPKVGFHAFTLLVFLVLAVLARRNAAE